MELYIVRHADAIPQGDPSFADDAARPLTPRGLEQARAVAEVLVRKGVPLGAVVTSPLLRAKQTAEEIVRSWPSSPPALHVCDQLAPGSRRRKLARALEEFGAQAVAAVGHEPDLSQFTAWLMGSKKAKIKLAKAGIACLRSDNGLGKGTCSLTGLVAPENRAFLAG